MNGDKPITIKEAIHSGRKCLAGRGIPNTALDCRVLLKKATGLEDSMILAYPGRDMTAEASGIYESFIQRRMNREPLSSILGQKEFWSLPFTITTDTLTPRPDTETLVTHTIDFIRTFSRDKRSLKILDIGTGCGNIPVAIATETENIRIFATDISLKALAVAKANASRFNLDNRIEFVSGNLLDHFKTGFDIIVSNPPYIRNSDLASTYAGLTDYEPENALAAGDDGLLFFRKIIDNSRDRLNSRGAIFFEVGYDQAEEVEKMLLDSGTFTCTSVFNDISGIPRVVSGTKE